MALSKKPYRGTRDFFPTNKRVLDYLFQKMKESAACYGYESYDGPLVEEVELYKAKSGEELINDQIYSFTDRGERFIAIRPEMTPTLARMIAQIHREESKPIRWYSIPNLMRYEKPQRGRLREHWQYNVDIFGAPGRYGEAEILQVAITLMSSLGATSDHYEILLNDRAIVDTVFNKLIKTDNDVSYKLYKILDKSKKVGLEAVAKMLSELNLSEEQINIFNQYLSLKNIKEVLNFLEQYNETEVAQNFKDFITIAESSGCIDYIKYDPSIVRGLDYYTGIVFEIFDKNPENRRAICGGGAYAGLLKIFNEPQLEGVGFGLGDVTLVDFLKTHNLLPNFDKPKNDIFISFQTDSFPNISLKLAKMLRDSGLNVVSSYKKTKMNKVFKEAENKGCSYVALFGDDELKSNQVTIKNIVNKTQETFEVSNQNLILDFFKL